MHQTDVFPSRRVRPILSSLTKILFSAKGCCVPSLSSLRQNAPPARKCPLWGSWQSIAMVLTTAVGGWPLWGLGQQSVTRYQGGHCWDGAEWPRLWPIVDCVSKVQLPTTATRFHETSCQEYYSYWVHVSDDAFDTLALSLADTVRQGSHWQWASSWRHFTHIITCIASYVSETHAVTPSPCIYPCVEELRVSFTAIFHCYKCSLSLLCLLFVSATGTKIRLENPIISDRRIMQ